MLILLLVSERALSLRERHSGQHERAEQARKNQYRFPLCQWCYFRHVGFLLPVFRERAGKRVTNAEFFVVRSAA